MAIEKKIDYVILGLLSHEDLTGYEKKRMDTSLKYFWGASHGRIRYSITEEGRNSLKKWLQMPAER